MLRQRWNKRTTPRDGPRSNGDVPPGSGPEAETGSYPMPEVGGAS
jgi:hypothetical protein